MIKPDEITFLMLMQLQCRVYNQPDAGKLTPRAIIAQNQHLVHPTRAEYLLDKWVGKGWYDYGTVLDLGWLTEDGKAASYQAEWNKQNAHNL